MSQLAKQVVDLTVGDAEESEPVDPKARKRGEARAEALSPERRSEIARKAARARWGKEEKSDGRSDDSEAPAP